MLAPGGAGPTTQTLSNQPHNVASYFILLPHKSAPFVTFSPLLKGLNPFLFRPAVNSSGTSHSPRGLQWPTREVSAKISAFILFFFPVFPAVTLRSTLNHTFHSPLHRGKPLNDDREREKFLHSPPTTPFCCRTASALPGNQTWLPAGGQC